MKLNRSVLGAGIAVVSAFALLTACGGDDDDGGSGDQPSKRPPSVPADAPFIDQEDLKFKPTSLTATAGEVIYFANAEASIHTVTINGTNESGTMKRDDIFQWTPDAAGEYKITCDFHPQMKATITVTG